MRLMTHVRRSSDGGFEVRIVVPSALRSTIGKANLTRRLGRLSKSEANRLAAPVIERFHAQIETARSGVSRVIPFVPATATAVTISQSGPWQPPPASRLMALFEGYVGERQPSAATIKRWRPVITNLTKRLGHDDARRIMADDIIGWKEALAVTCSPDCYHSEVESRSFMMVG